ncbi:hypothetical protein B0A55_03225 [Friedmanniomyces simplex]|uniref:Uncharacterized protein n=1 Tax=Friedmanniomyces simplex TaxID=329884 RepID=A0A4U0XM49_9PEZI|nr:hypothetical protein B0A55_03225 [Friedmanniomyces simplex]
MPTQRPFLSNFLAAFRAHSQPLSKASPSIASSTAVTGTATIWTSSAPTAKPSSPTAESAITSPRPINPKTNPYATSASTQQSQDRTLQHIVSPQTHLPRSPSSPGLPVYGPPNKPPPSYPTVREARRTRRGSASSSDSGGFREVRTGGGEKWFIGGRTAGGEDKYYKLSMVKRDRSADRISADLVEFVRLGEADRTMDFDSAPPSGSKRKRDEQDDTIYDLRDGRLEPADLDAHTPKRSRQSDTEGSDSTPLNQRNLRRKKKVNNLSNLNLRHAAEQQRVRESRFQEGSLTDKPSMKPSSAFMRMVRTDSGNIRQVDELMEGYNDDTAMPDVSLEASIRGEVATPPLSATFESAPRAESGGFFRFGRSFASNFHPVALWNKMWNETREDLIRQNAEEAKRKRRQKEEAEAKYAQMKAAGQLGLKQVSNATVGVRESEESARPRDSAVVLNGVKDRERTTSTGAQLLPPPRDDISTNSGSEVLESKTKGTFKSRFAFRKPSISNLKGGLKRVASDLNLTAGAARESSSSISPVKADSEHSTLKRSASKFDLKKQQKLSKRVSDLESKLQLARRELGEALVEASPKPKLNNKYERFTPQNTLKRPKFIPGMLPSLPSERILMAEQLGFGDDEASPDKAAFDVQPKEEVFPSERMYADGEDTVKARGSRQYPRRADSLFKPSDDKIDPLPNNNNITEYQTATSELTQFTNDSVTMDPNSITSFKSDGATEPAKTGDYASLDAKLKALDKQVKATKKASGKSKKRKSGAKDDEKLFRPGAEADDNAEWQEANATPRKKRKSTGKPDNSSPQGLAKRTRGSTGKHSPPKVKKPANGAAQSKKGEKKNMSVQAATDSDEDEYSEAESEDAVTGANEVEEVPARTSMDSQGQPLEPLYEEEEETSLIQLNGDPSKSSVNAPLAHYFGGRPRSRSPHKRTRSVQPEAEETLLVRAAEVAQGRRGRSASPAPGRVIEAATLETLTVQSSEDSGVQSLPNLQNVTPPAEGQAKTVITKTTVEVKVASSGSANEAFEWPEDVF